MEQEIKRVELDCTQFLINESESGVRFKLENEGELKEVLENITRFLESEYKFRDEDCVKCLYYKDKL